MPKFCANLSMLYTEYPYLERFEQARNDGFEAVESLFPYEHDLTLQVSALKDCGLHQVLINTPPGGFKAQDVTQAWASGDRGVACDPARVAEFKAGFDLALSHAKALGSQRIHVMAGCIPGEYRSQFVDPSAPLAQTSSGAASTQGPLLDTYLDNLAWSAKLAKQEGITVLIEPINTRDIPFYFLNRQAQAHAVIDALGVDNVKVQMDLYHCQIVEGDLSRKISQYMPTGSIGHFQIAGVPDRHEPDAGEVFYSALFDLIDQIAVDTAWSGWVGCEYRPRLGAVPGATSQGLGWFKALRESH